MSKRIIYYTGLVSLLLVWVLAQTPEEQAAAAPAQAEQVAPVTPVVVPGAVAPPAVPQPPSPTVPGKPSTTPKPPPNKAASPEANGITDGKLPTIQAGQNNKSVKAPKPADICDFAFNFPKLNAEGLGFVYRQLTGRRVVMTADVKDLEIYFVQPPPITYGEATDLLKAACLMHGFVFAPGGEGWDKLTTATQGPKPGTGDIPLVTSPLALPDGDEVVRYVMTLKYMKPDEVSRVFQTVVTQFNTFGSVVAVPNASALIITENTSLIRSLIELQAKIDVPSSDVQTKFFKVQFGDVEELAATLSEIFSQQSSSQATAGVQRVGQIQPANTAGLNNSVQVGGASSSGAGEAPPVQIVPDLRTNRIFVMARPIDLVFIETLIKEFDSPSDQRNFLRRKLKFLAVGDFLDVASDALTRAFGGSSGNSAGGAAGGAAGGRAPTSNSTGGRSSSSRSSGSSTSQFGGQSGTQSGGSQLGGGGSSGGIGSSGGLSDPQANTKPLSVLVGRTLLVADNITNSIVVQGPPAGVEIINNLLDEIDVKADQVMISTVFGQLSLSDNLEYGIDWLRDLDKTIGQPGRSGIGGTAGGVLPDITPITDFANSATKGLGIYGTIGDHLSGYLNALQETGDFNVISRPTIFTANNQKGTISSGTQIAVPSNSTQGINGGGQSTNIEYRNVVLSLEVIPLINSADEVTLQISLVSQGVGENRTIGAGVNAYDVPDIISRELLTTVTVPNNETVVLGGLITEENKKNISGVPILCQIPGIGKLFSKTTDDKSRNELLIFIRPNIIRDSRSLDQANRDMDNRYEISSDVRSFDAPQPSVLPIKPVEVIEDDKSVVPEKPVTAPGKNSKKVPSTAPDIDYNAVPKAKPVSAWKWFGK